MTLLRDQELYDYLKTGRLVIENLPEVDENNCHSRESPIQPASIDLRIKGIFVPGTKAGELGSEGKPRTEYSLKTGHMAILTTLEKICLPPNVAAIGLPPSRVSMAGLLMTNPGHVDPGYAGPMRFTVINMGTEPCALKRGSQIVTLLLFGLAEKAQKDWSERGHGSGQPPSQEDIDRLSMDFVDVERRAQDISERIVQQADLQAKKYAGIASLLAAVLSGLFFWFSGVKDQATRIAELEKSLSVAAVEARLDEFERRLIVIESPSQEGVSPQQPTPPGGG